MSLVSSDGTSENTTSHNERSAQAIEPGSAMPESSEAILPVQNHLASVGLLVDALDHDLRNAINVIKTADFFLRTKLGDSDPRLSRQVELIDNGCTNAVNLLQDLIEYANLPAPGLVPQTPVSAVSAAMSECGPGSTRFSFECDEDLPLIAMDDRYLKLAIRKLLQRALHGSPADAPLRIAVRENGGAVELSVEDRAPTLPDTHRQVIAEASSRSSILRPSNLPMALLCEIVKIHGGSVRCEPVDQNGSVPGSRITITLYGPTPQQPK